MFLSDEKHSDSASYRKDDSLPARLTQEPMPEGPSKDMVCHLDDMLDEYYEAQGWNQDGRPTSERLKELGLAR